MGGCQPFGLRQVIQDLAQIGLGRMAQGVGMPMVRVRCVPMRCVFRVFMPRVFQRMRLMQPNGGRERRPWPVRYAVPLPPKRSPQHSRHQQAMEPAGQAGA